MQCPVCECEEVKKERTGRIVWTSCAKCGHPLMFVRDRLNHAPAAYQREVR